MARHSCHVATPLIKLTRSLIATLSMLGGARPNRVA
jgi:hypothetical protein